MIGRLQGQLVEKQAPEILVDVNGVGYEVLVPMTTLYQLPEVGGRVTLSIHFAVSENSQALYGFYDKKDRELFRTLIKVSGVGPKMALAILSGMETDELVSCVMGDKVSALVKVPGVGKKTAERLIIELRDKLKTWQVAHSPLADMEAASQPAVADNTSDIVSEAESALVSLGYKPVEASKMVANVLMANTVTRSEELIRLSLRSLSLA
ncbi:Holliday junction branch migration protein RuvA [Aestuariicella hydrocarbonica]|uniref:Holliday junction branch migration complex subunit RuvA n=1 Tax=Pseudomaricurvus hydrocarbonicus TaxID=1470433 RepID=A0A9E5JY01_9GAMM|nr:Holliday junction branch migration protein RuvA [Aestuariicella hydrocarbonica]NHO64142.1 Holliday junction branch migration protein RuvA [Aestuariicella hydrocarbonica]